MFASARLEIAPEVADVLPPPLLAKVHDGREHTEVVCAVCNRSIPPESPEQVSVLGLRDPSALPNPGRPSLVVRYAHARCSPSRFVDTSLRPMPDEIPLAWTPILRRHALASALIWETVISVRFLPGSDVVDPVARRLRRAGFRSATQRMDDLVAPLVKQWRATLEDTVVIVDPNGHREELEHVGAAAPPGWVEAAHASRRLLVVYGSGFGQDRLDRERIDRVLQAGEALCGLIPVTGSHGP